MKIAIFGVNAAGMTADVRHGQKTAKVVPDVMVKGPRVSLTFNMIKGRLDEVLSEGVNTVRLSMPHPDEVSLCDSENTRLFIRGFLEPAKERAVFDVFLEMFRCEIVWKRRVILAL